MEKDTHVCFHFYDIPEKVKPVPSRLVGRKRVSLYRCDLRVWLGVIELFWIMFIVMIICF